LAPELQVQRNRRLLVGLFTSKSQTMPSTSGVIPRVHRRGLDILIMIIIIIIIIFSDLLPMEEESFQGLSEVTERY